MIDENLWTRPLEDVTAECRQQEINLRNNKPSDARFCYELFRRAFVNNDQIAWNAIFTQYYPQLVSWILKKKDFNIEDKDLEDYINNGLEKFLKQMRKKPFLESFPYLGGILKYLKACLISEYIDKMRKRNHVMEASLEELLPEKLKVIYNNSPNPETVFIRQENIDQLKSQIKSEIKNEKEKIVYESMFIYDMSAKEILYLNPDIFTKANQIYRVKENMLRRFQRKLIY